jgi:hypothetical protein
MMACLLGAVAGFLPGVSITAPFWGLNFMEGGLFTSLDDRRVRVIDVSPGSPAEQVGFRARDLIVSPERMTDIQKARDAAQRGLAQEFKVERDEQQFVIETGTTPKELAAIWYSDPWLPFSGLLFAGIGVLVLRTSDRVPAPRWRSILVISAASILAVCCGVSAATESVFSRWRVYQKWPMGTGAEWNLHQALAGVLAGVLLAVFAAIELRESKHRIAESSSL